MYHSALLLLFLAFISAVVLTACVRSRAIKRDFLSKPVSDRFSKKIVPLGGGIAIFSNIVFFLLLAVCLVKFLGTEEIEKIAPPLAAYLEGFASRIPQLLVFIVCLTSLFTLGLVDDKKHLSPYTKLFLQFIIAFFAVAFAEIRVEFFIHNQLITTVLSVFWIVFLINAFNFLDNMDGLSAGIAAIIAAVFLIAAALNGQVFISAMALLFIATLAGFLVFNFPPAKIYMGDAGSLLIGFIIATLSLKTTYYNQTTTGQWYPVFMPLIAMAVPLYDFVSVTTLRIKQGKSPFIGDTQHFSHRLKRHGLTDTQVTLTLYIATLCTSLSAAFLYQVNFFGAVLVALQTLLILLLIAIFESTAKNDKNKNSI
jgi:UDP-GlcNAc:undecaprenyl-phosphate GlcNAc-1-phosphate transferase